MNVTVMSATERPIETISLAAGTCYGKTDVSAKRVANCYRAGHMSVFEHAYVQFRIEGVSRACMAQLTRHRLTSFAVESQRYNRYDFTDSDDWCVIPPSIEANPEARRLFVGGARKDALDYTALLAMGVKPEDARYKLPEATKTNLVMTCNVRELFHIFDMRLATSAQWEIRGLAEAMRDAAANVNDQWRWLMELAS
ncbi:MAG: FAD-dependent thymidylate synthase [Clostridia bacterium]|nr:FAD-dependent thymidylate synthase [Clostridia bacterium]